MIAFATGGLLGDVFLHLVPHSFFGEDNGEHGHRTMAVEEKRNIIIGCVATPRDRLSLLRRGLRVGTQSICQGH
jgi:hypothetical protein